MRRRRLCRSRRLRCSYPGVCKDERNRVGELERLVRLLGLRMPEINTTQDDSVPQHLRNGHASVTLRRNTADGTEIVLHRERTFTQTDGIGISKKAMVNAMCDEVIGVLRNEPPVPPVTPAPIEGYDWADVVVEFFQEAKKCAVRISV